MKAKYEYWLSSEGLEKIRGWSAMGLCSAAIAEKIGVAEKTFSRWCGRFPKIESAAKGGEQRAVQTVEAALLKRAVGYTVQEITRQPSKDTGELEITKIVEKDVMPSTTAQIFWLKNRCGWDADGMQTEDEGEGGVVLLPPINED